MKCMLRIPSRYGTTFAFVAQVGLVASVGIAFTQCPMESVEASKSFDQRDGRGFRSLHITPFLSQLGNARKA